MGLGQVLIAYTTTPHKKKKDDPFPPTRINQDENVMNKIRGKVQENVSLIVNAPKLNIKINPEHHRHQIHRIKQTVQKLAIAQTFTDCLYFF